MIPAPLAHTSVAARPRRAGGAFSRLRLAKEGSDEAMTFWRWVWYGSHAEAKRGKARQP